MSFSSWVKQLTVQKMGHVYLSVDKHYYSVPYRFIGSRVSVMYNTSTVEVFHSRERIALHTRSGITGGYSTHKEHLSSSAKAYSEWSLEYFQDWAKKVGIATHQYVTELIESKPYPEIGYKQALGILSLKKQYEVERIETACKRALETPRRSYHFIETILINGMDKEDYQPENSLHKIHHSNIRGADNFK